MPAEYLLEVRHISKAFPGTQALQDVSMAFRPGEIHAVVGENGAGKSTLMLIIAGVHRRDAGEILLDGRPIEPMNPHHAQTLGVSIVYQELSMAPNLSVAENIFINRQPLNRWNKRASSQRLPKRQWQPATRKPLPNRKRRPAKRWPRRNNS